MVPLVEIPEIVRYYAPFFASVFSPEAWIQFQRYVSGLLISENKTVDGINRLFVVEVRNQSSLNRLLTESPFTVEALNQARFTLLASLPGTRLNAAGVLSIDDTLLTHYGQHFEKIAVLYDSTQKCYVWAHNLVNLHYSDDQTDYPVLFRLWEPAAADTLEAGLRAAGIALRASKEGLKTSAPSKWRAYLVRVWQRHQTNPEVGTLYQSKLQIAQDLLQQFVTEQPGRRLPVTFDNWYTQPPFCAFLDPTLKLAYVGTLAADDQVQLVHSTMRLEAFDQSLCAEHHQAVQAGQPPVFRPITVPYKGTDEIYYSYCRTHHIEHFGRQRLVINHQQADLSDPATFFISNRLRWQAAGITRIRRHRWPVEVYHEEGKADGLDQYQVRDFEAIQKHIALVAVTYSLLRAAQHDTTLLHHLQRQVRTTVDGSAGTWRRNTQAQALWALASFIATALAQGQSLQEVMDPILGTLAY
jgi:hypothetical protein